MNELHELAKVARGAAHYTRPARRGGWRRLHQLCGAALIMAGGTAWVVATTMRNELGRDPPPAQVWGAVTWIGGSCFVAGNLWYLTAWLVARRRGKAHAKGRCDQPPGEDL
jgi:hypothetical protein